MSKIIISIDRPPEQMHHGTNVLFVRCKMKVVKKFVPVLAKFDQNGITPLQIIWNDGRVFDIDRVLDIRPAASIKAGGFGIRYTCKILNKETYLFYEDLRWFVEAKSPDC